MVVSGNVPCSLLSKCERGSGREKEEVARASPPHSATHPAIVHNTGVKRALAPHVTRVNRCREVSPNLGTHGSSFFFNGTANAVNFAPNSLPSPLPSSPTYPPPANNLHDPPATPPPPPTPHSPPLHPSLPAPQMDIHPQASFLAGSPGLSAPLLYNPRALPDFRVVPAIGALPSPLPLPPGYKLTPALNSLTNPFRRYRPTPSLSCPLVCTSSSP